MQEGARQEVQARKVHEGLQEGLQEVTYRPGKKRLVKIPWGAQLALNSDGDGR